MEKFRVEQNSKEQIARAITGPDTEATHMVINGEKADELLRRERASKFNQQIEDMQEKFQKHIDAIQEAGQQIAADLQNIEIMPLTSYALISPFKTNPFQKIKTTSNGLITDLGGLAPQYKSQETGDIEEEKEYVRVGIVTETGTECKFLKPGDIVFYNIASEVQVPFFKFGFVIVAEQRILAVVNEGLTKRKQDVMNGVKTDE